MNALNISLPQSMREYVDQVIVQFGYGTASEYVRELIRADQRRRAEDPLELALLEGLKGRSIPLNEENRRRLRAEARKEARNDRAKRFRSITAMCYHYFDTMGFGDPEALYSVCEREAKRIKPDTKFSKQHLAFHKRNYRLRNDELGRHA
jgi:antitoxin ParD1/3/4